MDLIYSTEYLIRWNTFFSSWRDSPLVGLGLLIHEVCFSRSHTTTQHNRQDSPGRVISSSQRLLPDNTQKSLQIDIHVPRGIRTHDLSRQAAVDLRLRPRGHWDRQSECVTKCKNLKEDLTVLFPALSFIQLSDKMEKMHRIFYELQT